MRSTLQIMDLYVTTGDDGRATIDQSLGREWNLLVSGTLRALHILNPHPMNDTFIRSTRPQSVVLTVTLLPTDCNQHKDCLKQFKGGGGVGLSASQVLFIMLASLRIFEP